MKLRYLRNIVDLTLDREKCMGCRMCVEVCPHDVFIIEEKKAKIVDKDACMECGACGLNCPVDAIKVRSGVGCAYAVLLSRFTGKKPSCGDGSRGQSCCGSQKREESCGQSCN